MGCDGGTIPKRDELVKTKKKPEQKDKDSELSFRWQHCAITQLPLQLPIVADEMGRLFSKESVIECLLNKSEENALKEVAPHVRSLKDVKELSLTDNPAWIELVRGEAGDRYIDVQKSKWICPVAGMEMNGRFRFSYLWTCGCTISERALKEMMKLKEEGNECPKCQKLFSIVDIITLNPTEDKDFATLQEKMSLRHMFAKEAKEAKKGKKRTAASATVTSTSSSTAADTTPSTLPSSSATSSSKLIKPKDEPSSSSSKKPKLVAPPKPPTAAAASIFSAKAGTSSYSVAEDPKASEVYKSLFTTHQTHETQERAHWITYNPFYN